MREWYSVQVGDNKFVYVGKVYGHPNKPDGRKLTTGYINGIIINMDALTLTLHAIDNSSWLLKLEHAK